MVGKKISVLFTILVLLLSSCSAAKETIKIGFAGGLTGSGSNLSVDAMYGALLAVEQINSDGGVMNKEIELIIKNDEGNPETALAVDQELVDEGCSFIIGHMISSLVPATIQYINDNAVLMISPTIATDTLTGLDDHFIRLIPSNTTQAYVLSDAVAGSKATHLAVLYANSNALFAQTFIEAVSQKTMSDQFTLVKTFSFDSMLPLDYETLINELKQFQVDSLLIIASGDITAEFAQTFRLNDYHPLVFLPAWAMTNELIIQGGHGVESFFGVNYVQLDSQAPDYLEFKTNYRNKYGQDPTFSSIMAYESVMLVASAMRSSSSKDPMIVKQEIITNNQYKGLYGDLVIDEFGDASRTINLFQIMNGQFIRVEP